MASLPVFQPQQLQWPILDVVQSIAAEKCTLIDLLDPLGEPQPDLTIGSDQIPINSLEMLQIVDRVSEMFHLDRWGQEDNLLRWRTLTSWSEQVAKTWGQDPAEITFMTSGTSGGHKPCTHTLNHLLAECQTWQSMFRSRRRVVSCVPSHHIYGFIFTVLLPTQMDLPVVSMRHRPPTAIVKDLQPGDLVIAVPFWWQQVAHRAQRLPQDVIGLTSTARMPEATYRSLLASPLKQLVQIYGSSETAGIGFRDTPDQAYQLLPHWQHGEGEDALVDDQKRRIMLQDHLEWHDASHFQVKGRKDQMVQIGGHNVSPQQVAIALSNCPLVAEAHVRPTQAEEVSLKAFVVPKQQNLDLQQFKQQIFAWCHANLPSPQQPSSLSIGTSLPRDTMGKLKDWND